MNWQKQGKKSRKNRPIGRKRSRDEVQISDETLDCTNGIDKKEKTITKVKATIAELKRTTKKDRSIRF